MPGLAKDKRILPFIQGVDTKTDPKMLQPGKLTQLLNGSFKKPGGIQSRNGYVPFGADHLSPVLGTAALDGEALAFTPADGLKAWSPTAAAWTKKGYCRSAAVQSQGIGIDVNHALLKPDAGISGNVVVYAWVQAVPGNTPAGLWAAIYDWTTGAAIIAPTLIDAGGFKCAVVPEGTNITVYYSIGSSILFKTMSATTPTAGFTSSGTVVNADLVNHQWVAKHVDGNIGGTVLMWRSSAAANQIKIGRAIGGGPGTTTTFGTAFNDFNGCFNFGFDYRHNLMLAMAQSVTGTLQMSVLAFSAGAFTFLASNTITASGATFQHATAVCDESNFFRVFYTERNNANPAIRRVKYQLINGSANLSGTPVPVAYGCQLASDAFLEAGNKNAHVWVKNATSTVQATYFCVDAQARVIGKLLAGQAYDDIVTGISNANTAPLPQIWSPGASQIWCFTPGFTPALSMPPGVALGVLDLRGERFRAVQLGKNVIISGGALMMYDGQGVNELGFHLFPETPSGQNVGVWTAAHAYVVGDLVRSNPVNGFIFKCISAGTSGGAAPAWNTTVGASTGDNTVLWFNLGASAQALSDGTRSYAICFASTDARGQVHRSAPSALITGTVAGGSGVATTVITLPSLPLTQRANVAIEVYRTQAAGAVLYLVGSTPNDPTILATDPSPLIFIDGVADSTIASNPILYTTGALPNAGPPSAQALLVRNGKLYASGGENPTEVQVSQYWQPGQGVSFGLTPSGFVALDLDPVGGNIVGLAAMDEKLVILKNSQPFFVTGDGPSNTGAQSDFSNPQAIPADVGCLTADSVISTADGVFFQSVKGWHLVDRSMAVIYVGAPVEAFNADLALGAHVSPSLKQVRFTTANEVLVYDTDARQWSVQPAPAATTFTAGGIWNGQHLVAANSPTGYLTGLETPGTFSDFGALFQLDLTTGWIDLNGISGYARLYKVLLLLEDLQLDASPFGGSVVVAINYRDSTTTDIFTFTLSGNAGAPDYELFPQVQATAAIKVRVLVTRSAAAQDIRLNALGLIIGGKNLDTKLNSGQRTG